MTTKQRKTCGLLNPGFSRIALLIPQLQNLVIDKIMEIHAKQNTSSIARFKYVYEQTAVDSPLRMFVVEECWGMKKKAYWLRCESFPEETLLDHVTAVAGRPRGRLEKVTGNF